MKAKTKKFSLWKSPISAKMIASKSISFSEIRFDTKNIYWLETRPYERGRTVLVCLDKNDNVKDLAPKEFSARTRVHEYGGAPYLVHNSVIYFLGLGKK